MILLLLLALVAGVLLPVQAGVNAQLRSVVGSPLTAALISFLVGTAGLGTAAVILRAPTALRAAWAVSPWWFWIGGLIGALYVVATIVLAPRLGAATLVAAVVAGQMIASLLLDQYGLLGFPTHPMNGLRVLGAALVIVGVILVQR
jgi:bacterial/archaeal transporter family-2 protein